MEKIHNREVIFKVTAHGIEWAVLAALNTQSAAGYIVMRKPANHKTWTYAKVANPWTQFLIRQAAWVESAKWDLV